MLTLSLDLYGSMDKVLPNMVAIGLNCANMTKVLIHDLQIR